MKVRAVARLNSGNWDYPYYLTVAIVDGEVKVLHSLDCQENRDCIEMQLRATLSHAPKTITVNLTEEESAGLLRSERFFATIEKMSKEAERIAAETREKLANGEEVVTGKVF